MLLFVTICLLVSSTVYCEVEPEEWHGKYAEIYPGKIPGPRRLSERIGIVGAGPSGIHMAYLLKQRGFENVEILEATFDLGGKSKTLDYRGAKHEMGTCYLSADYEKNVLRLVRKFTNAITKPPPLASVWSHITPASPQPFSTFYAIKLKLRHPTKNMTEIQNSFLKRVIQYVLLHKKLFGEYYGELMPEPSTAVKKLIRGTFMEFLERHGLEDLEDLFIASFTLQGYGNLRDVPALYGLMWNTPKLVHSLIDLANGKAGAIYMLKDGFQNLWRSIVEKSQLKITYGIKIKHIYLNNQGNFFNSSIITYGVQKFKNRPNDNVLVTRAYDFLVWTPPAGDFIKVSSNCHMVREWRLFSHMTNSYYSTSLVNDVGTKRAESAVNWWYENIQHGHDMSVWANRDSYTMFNDLNGPGYSNQLTFTGNDVFQNMRTSVFYQFSHTRPSKKDLAIRLRKHLQNMGAETVHIKKQYPWKYFTRFTQEQIERGSHWRTLELQGRRRVWFVGSSVSFESVKSVVEYNQLLVDRMEEPSG